MYDPTYFENLSTLLPTIPEDSIVSKTVVKNEHMDVILFGFAPGQSLSEHTSARPAMLYFLSGEAELTLGDRMETAVPGTFAAMPPHLPHSITAKTAVSMLLILTKA
ncbi:MAG: cupin domain-containing protein [Candidatus Promineifilaceae bacterium]